MSRVKREFPRVTVVHQGPSLKTRAQARGTSAEAEAQVRLALPAPSPLFHRLSKQLYLLHCEAVDSKFRFRQVPLDEERSVAGFFKGEEVREHRTCLPITNTEAENWSSRPESQMPSGVCRQAEICERCMRSSHGECGLLAPLSKIFPSAQECPCTDSEFRDQEPPVLLGPVCSSK